MRADNILVLAIDGLRASALGAYGNASFPTPALDELAAESFLFDVCFSEAAELPLIYRALWRGLHPLRKAEVSTVHTALPHRISECGYATTLITDEPRVASLASAEAFDECLQSTPKSAERASDVSQTALAELFSAVSDQIENELETPPRPRFVWVHTRGLYGPWDAPLELQESLLACDEGDPEPSDAIEPPDFMVDSRNDPDAAFRCQCAYAAQVIALDECLAGLLQAVRSSSSPGQWLVVLFGVRGFPLGEHGRVGGVDERLFAEQLHVPMLWRFPDGAGRLARDGQLASLSDVLPTLLDCLSDHDGPATAGADGVSFLPRVDQSAAAGRNSIISASTNGTHSIRTADWSLRSERPREEDGDAVKCELFVRPDDRWESNDVAGLCPEIVERLSAELQNRVKGWEDARAAEPHDQR